MILYEFPTEKMVLPPSGKKTFGWMDVEGHPDGYLSIGPKKYLVKKGPIIEYKANGIRPDRNTEVDIEETFKTVLYEDRIATLHDANITCTGLILKHSDEGAMKKVRLRKFKGKIDDNMKIQWWDNEEEYKAYVDSVIKERDEDKLISSPIPMDICD